MATFMATYVAVRSRVVQAADSEALVADQALVDLRNIRSQVHRGHPVGQRRKSLPPSVGQVGADLAEEQLKSLQVGKAGAVAEEAGEASRALHGL